VVGNEKMEISDDGAEEEEQSDELAKTRSVKIPQEPSAKERQRHEDTGHAQYRDWCPHCVYGRATGQPHRRAQKDESELPMVAMDYGYMSKEQEKCLPMLVARDLKTKCYAATFVENKGMNDYAVSFLVGFIRALGYKRFEVQSDNEGALLALIKRVGQGIPDVEILP